MRNFSAIVREVVMDLKRSEDERLETMLHFSPDSEHDLYFKIINMWEMLANEEKKYRDIKEKDWIYNFLDAAHSARTLPDHAYLNDGDREAVIKKIKEHTHALKSVYSAHGIDANLISNDGQFFHGFSPQEGNFKGFTPPTIKKRLKGDNSKVSINETLDFFEEYAIEELRTFSLIGKNGVDNNRPRFVRELGYRNLQRYGDPLYQVVRIATEAIYKYEYGMPRIHTLINGRRS